MSRSETSRNLPPIVTPLLVYVISIASAMIITSLPAFIHSLSKEYIFSHLYLFGTLGQIAMDLPAVIMSFRMQTGSQERISLKGHLVSATIGILSALLLAGLRIAFIGHLMQGRFMGGVPAFTQSLALTWPTSGIAVSLALLAYGPGEALWVVYFIRAFDQVMDSQRPLVSKGVILASILWALPHIFNVFFFGWSALGNVVTMLFIGIIMGLLLKGTKSPWGPMLFWTLVNGTSA